MARSTTLPEPWRSLSVKLGSVQALADAIGVKPLAIRRYASGEIKMGGSARKLFDALIREHKIEAT